MSKLCTYPECGRKFRARGVCSGHYQQLVRGDELSELGPWGVYAPPPKKEPKPIPTREETFWSRVEKTDTCWLWTGAKVQGYGNFKYRGERCYAHRYSYELATGEPLGGKVIDHLCHAPACVRPSHLRPATGAENMQNLQGAQVNSSSGIRGVYRDKERGTWFASVKANGKRYRKRFSNVADATAWAESTRATLHRVPPIS